MYGYGSGSLVPTIFLLAAAAIITVRRYVRSPRDREVIGNIVSDRQAMVPGIIVGVVSLTLSTVDNGVTWGLLGDLVLAAALGLFVATVVHYGLDRRRRRHAG